jgi:hypothetical protein
VTSASIPEHQLILLSRLLLAEERPDAPPVESSPRASGDEEMTADLLLPEVSENLVSLANSHHVVIRAFRKLQRIASAVDNDGSACWFANEIKREEARIRNAVSFLDSIVKTLNSKGCPVVVIKSLDHWPDLGSDLDLYTNANSSDVIRVMSETFGAHLHPRSWGDRLANKWNFMVPELPEAVEVHVGRLGQTGEHVSLAHGLVMRARSIHLEDHVFPVAAAEDRLMIATLQRMYRHFYVRLCDIVDTTQLIDDDGVDYAHLRSVAETSGIWEGLATYLLIVSDYVARYRGRGLDLPVFVRTSAKFGGDRIRYGRGFLRIPILPHAARLYATELRELILSGKLKGSLRLGLLPCLATAAALEYKISGNDKGIW